MPQELVLDSSQISVFLECPQKQDYEYAQSIIQIDPASGQAPRISDKIAAGTLGHKYLEIYYDTLARVGDPVIAARKALDFSIPENSLEYPLGSTLRAKVRSRFGDYLVRYAPNDYTVATRTGTKIGLNKNGSLADISYPIPLIEQGFSYVLLDTPEYYFVLEGRIDFIGSQRGELFFMDHKWQFRERVLYSKSVQFRNYALVTGLYLGVVNYIRLHDKILPNTFARQPLSFSAADSLHWKQELIEIYIRIAKEKFSTQHFRNRFACAGKFGTPCQYIPLCDALSLNEREFIKKSNYVYREPWKPWHEMEN